MPIRIDITVDEMPSSDAVPDRKPVAALIERTLQPRSEKEGRT